MRLVLLALLALGGLAACQAPQRPAPATRPITAAPRAAEPVHPGMPGALERLGIAVRATMAGLMIVALDMDGPAAQAGASVGDILVGVNGRATRTPPELERELERAASAPMRLDVLRAGRPEQLAVGAAAEEADWNPLGLQLREASGQALKALDLRYGLMVAKVRAPADRTRILPGDVIVAVDQRRFASLDEFNRLVGAHHAGAIGLLVRRADSDLYIAIVPGGMLETRFARGRPLRT